MSLQLKLNKMENVNNMVDLVTFHQATQMAFLGFDDVCQFTYGLDSKTMYEHENAINSNLETAKFGTIAAPTRKQAIEWYRNRINMFTEIVSKL